MSFRLEDGIPRIVNGPKKSPRPPRRIPPLRQRRPLAVSCPGRGHCFVAQSAKKRRTLPAISHHGAAYRPTNPAIPKSCVDRHRGGGHPPTPATPPCVRVRTRRFETVTLTLL